MRGSKMNLRRIVLAAMRWILRPQPPLPSPGSGDGEKPLWVGANLEGIERVWEMGLMFQRYPSIEEIAGTLPVDLDEAEWLWHACNVADPVLRVVWINDAARALLRRDCLFEQIARQGLLKMQIGPIWKREV